MISPVSELELKSSVDRNESLDMTGGIDRLIKFEDKSIVSKSVALNNPSGREPSK
jgi:hypothetical protein